MTGQDQLKRLFMCLRQVFLFLNQLKEICFLAFCRGVVAGRDVSAGFCSGVRLIRQHLSKDLVVFEVVSLMEGHFLSTPRDSGRSKVHLNANCFHMTASQNELTSHWFVNGETLDFLASTCQRQFREHGVVDKDMFVAAATSICSLHCDICSKIQ